MVDGWSQHPGHSFSPFRNPTSTPSKQSFKSVHTSPLPQPFPRLWLKGRLFHFWASLVAQMVKPLPAMWETWVQSLGREDLLEKRMATHSSTLAWKIPWAEEPSRLLCNSVTVLIASEIPGLLGEIRLKGTSRGVLKKLHIKYYFPQQLSACFVPDSSRCLTLSSEQAKPVTWWSWHYSWGKQYK